ncbi:unnamed protein product, partial [Ectocarpus sp. 12 AP-2014]
SRRQQHRSSAKSYGSSLVCVVSRIQIVPAVLPGQYKSEGIRHHRLRQILLAQICPSRSGGNGRNVDHEFPVRHGPPTPERGQYAKGLRTGAENTERKDLTFLHNWESPNATAYLLLCVQENQSTTLR